MKLRKKIIQTGLVALLLSTNSQAGSLNPRDYDDGIIVPSAIVLTAINRFNAFEVSTIVTQMEAEGVKESVVVAQFSADGAIYHATRDLEGFKKAQTEMDGFLIPFKVTIGSDGSHKLRVALFSINFPGNKDFTTGNGWISFDDLTMLEKRISKDASRDLENTENILADANAKLGIFQSYDQMHNFYLTLGASINIENEMQAYGKDGYKYNYGSASGMEYRVGAKYSYGQDSDLKIDLMAGYSSRKLDGRTTTQYNYDKFDADVEFYNETYDQFVEDTQVYESVKDEWAIAHDIKPRNLSEHTYGAETGIYRPSFDLDTAAFKNNQATRSTQSIYGKFKLSKYLPKKNIKLILSVDGKINLEDQLTGPNLNESLGDKYNIGVKGRIEF